MYKIIHEIEWLDGLFNFILSVDEMNFWMYVDNNDKHDPYFLIADSNDLHSIRKVAHLSMLEPCYIQFDTNDHYNWDEWILSELEKSKLIHILNSIYSKEYTVTNWQMFLCIWNFESHCSFFSMSDLDEEYNVYTNPLYAFVHHYFDRFSLSMFYSPDTPIPDYTKLN